MKTMWAMLVCGAALLGWAASASAGDLGCKVQRSLDSVVSTGLLDECPRERPGEAVPEPSSALVFGAGLLVASQVARRRRR